ncbi:MAG: cyclopropane-fatty-acyl-phospholipid synthase family protein [Candidatus Accumulibacter phosphatis]|jgi:cyclopropane-fatty-acyl-phospholipid synthase|uniref:Cyclopropane-fatty-acyl-phospholipid synthase n=2 Tax=Candidatus Accumulibacter TaxID=327159 RepID=A0A080LT86_9PROT|nr:MULTISPECIES: cyclopropane-fatty-acyl-phospholipid synthase family protein [Candidatus Accumulibacter]KFB71707.1 MAG: Cyclopropane-fatty-acyl-phospholipid synthase [Candidatus Accumulibacter phosphatis]MBL8409042.1 class I SAM-dependent methyltransferase [Accumulibacter sp.]NMQ04126.1 class I SAM-dependent methyltransferase [Candidatus Accumulibacter contiguus]HRF13462.1 cyclopropane-fatty-acyl-phospholipid synthase family protein [Candidatus Accumulibacter phosphatis]
MNTLTLRQAVPLARDARLVFDLLERLQGGLLEVRLPDGSSRLFGDGEHGVTLQVHDEAMFAQVLARGDIGLAAAYLDGAWNSPDVTGLLTLLAKNRSALRLAVYGRWRHLLAARIRHLLNGNSRAGSKRNIMAHYDLGNEFYRLWLDSGMSYSSALYGGVDAVDLETAQIAKYRRILSRLQAQPGQSVLEIGCGWGGLAEMAVRQGLQVTGLTLSPAQLEWARKRVPEADLRLQDYRDTREKYDHIVSIEMFEAVGERWWPTYFRTLAKALKPGGRAVIQSITIGDELFADYRKGTDFIQQYIFPGGMLPSPSAFRAAAARQGLAVQGEHAFGEDYARTLAEWRQAFDRNWPRIAALGFDEPFRRLWRLYLCYCEAGFLAGNIDVFHFELTYR